MNCILKSLESQIIFLNNFLKGSVFIESNTGHFHRVPTQNDKTIAFAVHFSLQLLCELKKGWNEE